MVETSLESSDLSSLRTSVKAKTAAVCKDIVRIYMWFSRKLER